MWAAVGRLSFCRRLAYCYIDVACFDGVDRVSGYCFLASWAPLPSNTKDFDFDGNLVTGFQVPAIFWFKVQCRFDFEAAS